MRVLVMIVLFYMTMVYMVMTGIAAIAAGDPAPVAKKVVVYDFSATWCGPCRAFAPTFAAWETKYKSDNVTFVKVNIDVSPQMKNAFRITAIPSVLITVDGVET
jgi:thiol-disulfide isomerase/thioredoxin